MQLVKTSRDTLLRPLQIVSGIIERRYMPHPYDNSRIVSKSGKSTPGLKASSDSSSSVDSAGDGQPGQSEAGGGNSGDDGGGDSDPDSDRRRSRSTHTHPSRKPPRSPAVRRPSPKSAPAQSSVSANAHQRELIAALLLSTLYLSMIILFAYTGHVKLVSYMLAGIPGFACLIRCFIKPK